MSSTQPVPEESEPSSVVKIALHTVLKAVKAALAAGLKIYLYKFSHAGLGGKVIFYYWDKHTHHFVLHTRSEKMTINPGLIDAAGGCFNDEKNADPVTSTKDEVLEEHGREFYEKLSPTFISSENIGSMISGSGPNPLYMDSNIDARETYVTLYWYVKIPEDIAKLAIAGDREVKEINILSLAELHRRNNFGHIVPDIYKAIMNGLDNHKIH